MTAKLREQITAFHQFLIHRICLDRPTASLYSASSFRQYEHRLIICFTDPSCNNTSKALMTVWKIHYQHSVLTEIIFLNALNRLFFSLLCHGFSALIQIIQIIRKLHCIFHIIRKKQFQRSCCCIKPSACIDTWANNKPYMICRNLCTFKIIHTNQCFQPFKRSRRKFFQSFLYNDPVLSLQIHDITYCCNCCQFKKIPYLITVNPQSFI